MAIFNRDQFKEYCLRQLGAPVIEINVAPEQIEDRVDDALQKFWEFHGDGAARQFLAIQVTQEDIDNQFILIPEGVISVLKVFPLIGSASKLNLEYQFFMTEILNPRNIISNGIHGYVIAEQYIKTINEFFNREKMIRWNRYSNKLYMDTDWKELVVDDFILVEVYAIIDPSDFDEAWNDIWLKSYTTALIKKQWGQNMIKYDGFQLPNGIVLNGRQIYDDANNEIEKLEEELQNTWQLPPDFMVG